MDSNKGMNELNTVFLKILVCGDGGKMCERISGGVDPNTQKKPCFFIARDAAWLVRCIF